MVCLIASQIAFSVCTNLNRFILQAILAALEPPEPVKRRKCCLLWFAENWWKVEIGGLGKVRTGGRVSDQFRIISFTLTSSVVSVYSETADWSGLQNVIYNSKVWMRFKLKCNNLYFLVSSTYWIQCFNWKECIL